MLRELHIRNFSIIDDATIEFGEGFNVLTGETGAGKSIIIHALSLALGERATGDFIRSGEKEAVVEAFFDTAPESLSPPALQFLRDNAIDFEDGLILRRVITAQGRSRAYINGSMVNLQTLSDISRNIIDVHGQYEHQSLLSPESQLELLDAYGGHAALREETGAVFEKLCTLKQRIADLLREDRDRARRLDILRFQIDEIEAAGLSPGEDEELSGELKILDSAGRLAELANEAYEAVYSSDFSCITTLSKVLNALREIAAIDARANEALKAVEDALPLLEETGYFLRDYRESLDFDPQRLGQVQERLELIKKLAGKYGDSIEEILRYKENAVAELEGLEHAGETLETYRAELEQLKQGLTEKARLLSEKRKKSAAKIEKEVVARLSELSMPDTEFSVRITHEKGEDTTDGFRASRTGIDNIEFLISPNIGEEPRPLSKTASGGELSRVMLALKAILAKGDKVPVLVFDEIDAGIGGMTAETVGRKLKGLSSYHQVICITHLPQIAAFADRHLKIQKRVRGDRTRVEISTVEKDERTEEVARMLSGGISDVSIRHAEEILKKARSSLN
ncbi:MAG: DNA repair protein RecN [Deferribacteres bacterium]|nr:DNA repair protein RecN [Deferribacteres bacterium]